MPSLSCRICGRVVYTTASHDDLFAEERRCPRCGGLLYPERRLSQRRTGERRKNPVDDPGPPGGTERREQQRRRVTRRRDEGKAF